MSFYPFNPNLAANAQQQTDAPGVEVSRAFLARLSLTAAQAATADADGVLAAVTDNEAEQVITTGITNPPYARNITATAGGTAGDIKAIQVIVAGTNLAGEAITETLPAFTVDTAGAVTGDKAFATVTSITIPAHDGTGATTAVGFGDKIGLPDYLPTNTVLLAALAGTLESTAATVVADADELEKNTVDLNSALNGTAVDVYYLV